MVQGVHEQRDVVVQVPEADAVAELRSSKGPSSEPEVKTMWFDSRYQTCSEIE